jgi:hypothetical protein
MRTSIRRNNNQNDRRALVNRMNSDKQLIDRRNQEQEDDSIQVMTNNQNEATKDEEDRSVLQIRTFPWKGTIFTKGNSSIGFLKEPKPAENKSDNIWPAFLEGDIVQVLGIGQNNWLKVSRIRDKKVEIGYVDWRYVKTDAQIKTAKGRLIKKKYFEIADKGASHYLEAIQYLVDTYNLDTSHTVISYDPTITGAYAITEGNVGDKTVPVRIAPVCFSKSEDFGIICRTIAHELIHAKQKAVGLMNDHDEREFLAYYDTITRTDMPDIKDMTTLKFFIGKATKYYNALPILKKIVYASKKREIDAIKTKHKF